MEGPFGLVLPVAQCPHELRHCAFEACDAFFWG